MLCRSKCLKKMQRIAAAGCVASVVIAIAVGEGVTCVAAKRYRSQRSPTDSDEGSNSRSPDSEEANADDWRSPTFRREDPTAVALSRNSTPSHNGLLRHTVAHSRGPVAQLPLEATTHRRAQPGADPTGFMVQAASYALFLSGGNSPVVGNQKPSDCLDGVRNIPDSGSTAPMKFLVKHPPRSFPPDPW